MRSKRGGVPLVLTGLGVVTGLVVASKLASASTPAKKEEKDVPKKKTTPAAKTSTPAAKSSEPSGANVNKTEAVTLAMKYATLFGMPPSLLLAILAIESGWNPKAQNPKAAGGAWGYGQVLLSTANDETKRFAADAKKYWPKFNGTGQSLLDGPTNIAIAAHYLARMWKRYAKTPGNWFVTGVSYQQGPGNVDKQLKANGGKLVPDKLPPNGKEYYRRLQTQFSTNPVVAKALTQEVDGGKFAYIASDGTKV